ncbi:MAG: hypothetical protein JST85_21625 [Acidobacteria bacterium]|nr:hypothetical protein [Acidobacteriota bacterium]
MNFPERWTSAKNLILIVVVGLVLFLAGFWLARSPSVSQAKTEPQTAQYQFMQIGDSVAAINVQTGEAYAIDGNARAWVMLAPALPSKENRSTK